MSKRKLESHSPIISALIEKHRRSLKKHAKLLHKKCHSESRNQYRWIIRHVVLSFLVPSVPYYLVGCERISKCSDRLFWNFIKRNYKCHDELFRTSNTLFWTTIVKSWKVAQHGFFWVSSEDIVWGKRHRQRNHQPQLLVTKKRIPLQPAKHAYVEYQHGEGIFNCSTNQHCYTVHLMTRTATKAGSSMFKPCAWLSTESSRQLYKTRRYG